MNRREMLQSGLSVIAAVGIDGEIATMTPQNPQAFVLKFKMRQLTPGQRKHVENFWKEKFKGTQVENVPLLVLDESLDLEIIDAPKGK